MGPLGRGELIIRGGGGVSVLTENQESILRQCLSAADLASPTTRDLSRCWGGFVVAGWETPWGLYVPNKVAKLIIFGYVVRKNAGPWRQGARVRCLARKKEKTKENGRLAIDLVGGSGVVALWSRRGVRSVFFLLQFSPGKNPSSPCSPRSAAPGATCKPIGISSTPKCLSTSLCPSPDLRSNLSTNPPWTNTPHDDVASARGSSTPRRAPLRPRPDNPADELTIVGIAGRLGGAAGPNPWLIDGNAHHLGLLSRAAHPAMAC